MTKITFSVLSFCFPVDTLWVTAGAEIVGYSAVKNLHFVISDGNCISERWTVHVFSPNDKNAHQQAWYPLAGRTPCRPSSPKGSCAVGNTPSVHPRPTIPVACV